MELVEIIKFTRKIKVKHRTQTVDFLMPLQHILVWLCNKLTFTN